MTGTVCSPPVCASSGKLAWAMRSQKRVKRRSLQWMFWQLGKHFIMTAPAPTAHPQPAAAAARAVSNNMNVHARETLDRFGVSRLLQTFQKVGTLLKPRHYSAAGIQHMLKSIGAS